MRGQIAVKDVQMREGIEKGDTVSRTAAATGLFTPLVLQMVERKRRAV